MRKGVRKRLTYGKVVGVVVGFTVLGGVALAAIPNSDGTIQGCYDKKTGVLRVVNSASGCTHRESGLNWNQRGVTGATGPTGPSGTGGAGPWAIVRGSDGTLFKSSGAVSATRNFTGSYTIVFDQTVADGGDKPACATAVTPMHLEGDTTTVTVVNPIVYTGSPTTLHVELRKAGPEMVDQSFSIALSC